jgi:hypothetical protein
MTRGLSEISEGGLSEKYLKGIDGDGIGWGRGTTQTFEFNFWEEG